MSEYHERRRAMGHLRHPHSAAALGEDVDKPRPSLSSLLPPTPVVPSTPLPRANPSVANHHHHYHHYQHHQPPFQQRPSTATSTTSSNLSDPPSTHGMMKRLLAKPAPPSSPTASFSLPSMRPGFHHEYDHNEREITYQDTAQEITTSSSLPTHRSTSNESDKSMRAIDLRKVFRRRPSGTVITTPSVPTSEDPIALEDSIPPPSTTTTSTIPHHSQFSRRSFSSPTRNATSKKSSVSRSSSSAQSHPTKRNKVEQSPVTPDHTGLADNSAGGAGDMFWDTCDWDKKREQRRHGVESSRTLSGKWGKDDLNHQIRPNHGVQRFTSIDKDHTMVKKLPDIPAGDSPSRRLWKLVKKISVSGLRDRNQANHDHPPPVPPLPSNLRNNPFYQHRTQSDSSLVSLGLKKAVSAATSASSPSTPLDKYKTTVVPSTSPSTSPRHHTKLSHSASHPTTGPHPSTTTRSSSPASDVASSKFFNRQSARSSTSSLGEEAIPLPPLPKSLISIPTSTSRTNRKLNADDNTIGSRRLPHHIVPPSELISRNNSSTNLPRVNPIAIPIPIRQPLLSMEDDWTIVRTPSVEWEVSSLPPPPRQLLKGLGNGTEPKKTGQRSKARTTASVVLPDMPSVQVDRDVLATMQVDRNVSNNAPQEDRNIIEETEQGDKGKEELNTDRDSNRSQSPTIPSFSTSSAINSFPARRVSASLSARSKGSPVALSPNTSNISSGSVFSTANVLRSPPQSPQHPGSRTTFGRVRQHLYGTNDEAEEIDEVSRLPPCWNPDIQTSPLRPLPQPPRQQERKIRKHHRYSSSGSNTAKSKSTHAVSASSESMPASPVGIASSHRRSGSFNKSSAALPIHGFFPSPTLFSDAPRSAPSPRTTPSSPVAAPSPTSRTGHRARSSSNLRSGFSSRKLSEVLFSSSSSMSLSMSPELGSSTPSRGRPPSPANHGRLGTFLSRSISVGPSNRYKSNTPNTVRPSQSRSQLTDQEKTDKWNDLLARSARAGGTLHLAAGSVLLGSDDI